MHADLFSGWQDANEIAKPRVSINSISFSTGCKKLQPEIEIRNRK